MGQKKMCISLIFQLIFTCEMAIEGYLLAYNYNRVIHFEISQKMKSVDHNDHHTLH